MGREDPSTTISSLSLCWSPCRDPESFDGGGPNMTTFFFQLIITIRYAPLSYPIGDNRKRSEQLMNADHKSLKQCFRLSGDKRQSKTLFLTILDLRSSIVLTCSIAAYLVCY